MSKLYLADPSGYDVKMNEIARHFSHKVEVYPPGSCPITMQISMLRTAANQTCGKCVPCRDGLPLVARLMQKVLDGRATEKTLDNIRMMATMIRSSADCAIGWNAAGIHRTEGTLYLLMSCTCKYSGIHRISW